MYKLFSILFTLHVLNGSGGRRYHTTKMGKKRIQEVVQPMHNTLYFRKNTLSNETMETPFFVITQSYKYIHNCHVCVHTPSDSSQTPSSMKPYYSVSSPLH